MCLSHDACALCNDESGQALSVGKVCMHNSPNLCLLHSLSVSTLSASAVRLPL